MLVSNVTNDGIVEQFRSKFAPRDFFIHDGSRFRHFRIGLKTQVAAAAAAVMMIGCTVAMTAQVALGGAAAGGKDTAGMQSKVDAMRADVEALRREAVRQAADAERRQAFLAAIVAGEDDPAKLAALLPAEASDATGAVAAPFQALVGEQAALAAEVRAATEARYRSTAQLIRRLGISPDRFHARGGMGGPYEPVDGATARQAVDEADPQFKALFLSWKKLDQLEQGVIAIPSQRPVDNITFTSGFGVRSDPFRGTAAMHAGVDIPGAYGTPIYATADGLVGRAGWAGGYGNLVELEHGKGIQTRYGHLSRILVAANTRVKRGQMIALMGSTGRSTGSHLHYEVRIDGRAANPMPFLQQTDHLAAVQNRTTVGATKVAMGGPAN